MEPDRAEPPAADTPAARLRPVWRTTLELQAGMVIAKPVSAASGGYATMSLSAGGTITEETIAQMMVKGIECVAVFNTDPPAVPEYARATEQYAARLRQIFGPEPTPNCQALLDALLQRGPMPC